MSPQPLDPDEAVRRLLADARHDAPVPDDVVRRLDATLAELVAERAGTALTDAPPAPVVDLAARRRRLGGAVLAAASVAVVAGLALPQMLPEPTSDTASNANAGSAERSEALSEPTGEESRKGITERDAAGSDAEKESAQISPRVASQPLELSSSASVAANLALLGDVGQGTMANYSVDLGACADAVTTRDVVLPVSFDGEDALAVWLPRRDPQRVVVRRCVDGVRLWSATLP